MSAHPHLSFHIRYNVVSMWSQMLLVLGHPRISNLLQKTMFQQLKWLLEP